MIGEQRVEDHYRNGGYNFHTAIQLRDEHVVCETSYSWTHAKRLQVFSIDEWKKFKTRRQHDLEWMRSLIGD